MQQVGVRELKNKLSGYLHQVEQGEEIQVTQHGKTIARLVPVDARPKSLDAMLAPWIAKGAIIPPETTGPRTGARGHLPLKVPGTPLSQLIIEERR